MDDSVMRFFVSVPVACFRVAYAREYWETYPCPPPSTIYGMLLSLVGETDRFAHQGVRIAIALVSKPHRSVVLRTLWRIKNKKKGLGLDENARPDFQELLTDIRLSVWLGKGEDDRTPSLLERVYELFSNPADISRFGGLSLGESTHLVDEFRSWRVTDAAEGEMLINDEKGNLTLPIWPDHVGSKGTKWGQFRLDYRNPLNDRPNTKEWITPGPPV